jgi:hypothetical protein
MAIASPCKASEIRRAVLAIGAAGLIAGTLDLAETLVVFGAKSPLVIPNLDCSDPIELICNSQPHLHC